MNPILIIGIGTYPVQVLQRTFKYSVLSIHIIFTKFGCAYFYYVHTYPSINRNYR